MNLYEYAGDDPVNEVDPSGEDGDPTQDVPSGYHQLIHNALTAFAAQPQFQPGSGQRVETANFVNGITPMGIVGGVTGRDPISGQKLSPWQRVQASLFAALQIVGIHLGAGAGAADEIALGTTREGLPAVSKLAPEALNYQDLGLRDLAHSDLPAFAGKMLSYMNGAKSLHFSLDGLTMIHDVLTGNPAYNALGSTNWELRTVWDNSSLASKTTFYLGGKAISAAAVARLP